MMELNTTLLLLGEPVETTYGFIKPFTVKKYSIMESHLAVVTMTPLHLYYQKKKIGGNTLKRKELKELEKLKEMDLYEYLPLDDQLLLVYITIINEVVEFKEGYTFHYILATKESFDEFRSIIMQMNFLKEEKVYKEERLQELEEVSKKLSSGNGARLSDIITTVVINSNYTYETIGDISILQLYAQYLQIAQEKDYETTTLFATVSSEAKIEHWSKHIDLFKETESKDIKRSEVVSKIQGAF